MSGSSKLNQPESFREAALALVVEYGGQPDVTHGLQVLYTRGYITDKDLLSAGWQTMKRRLEAIWKRPLPGTKSVPTLAPLNPQDPDSSIWKQLELFSEDEMQELLRQRVQGTRADHTVTVEIRDWWHEKRKGRFYPLPLLLDPIVGKSPSVGLPVGARPD